jgi:hypothetical protein
VCVCVCFSVRMHSCMHAFMVVKSCCRHLCVLMCVAVYACTHVCMHVRSLGGIDVYSVFLCGIVYLCVCMYSCLYTCRLDPLAGMCVCVYVHRHVCACVYMCDAHTNYYSKKAEYFCDSETEQQSGGLESATASIPIKIFWTQKQAPINHPDSRTQKLKRADACLDSETGTDQHSDFGSQEPKTIYAFGLRHTQALIMNFGTQNWDTFVWTKKLYNWVCVCVCVCL